VSSGVSVGRGVASALRILASITCYNEAHIVGATIEAVMRQSAPVKHVLLVDNASTDGVVELNCFQKITIVRNPIDLGSGGGFATGIDFARTNGYDWVWLLDADTRPAPNILELLIELLCSSAPDWDRDVGVVSPSHDLLGPGRLDRGRLLTPGGPRHVRVGRDKAIDCDAVMWSGALINTAVVAKVGLPRVGRVGCWEDLSMDYGDMEYTYRIRLAGYKVLVHRDCVIEHRVGDPLWRRILGFDVRTTNHSAFRRYLYFRNMLFFWLRLYPRRNWPVLILWFAYRLAAILGGIVLIERHRGAKIQACILGIRDGLLGRMDGNLTTSA
jgi:GT2 family glycosyltransferase